MVSVNDTLTGNHTETEGGTPDDVTDPPRPQSTSTNLNSGDMAGGHPPVLGEVKDELRLSNLDDRDSVQDQEGVESDMNMSPSRTKGNGNSADVPVTTEATAPGLADRARLPGSRNVEQSHTEQPQTDRDLADDNVYSAKLGGSGDISANTTSTPGVVRDLTTAGSNFLDSTASLNRTITTSPISDTDGVSNNTKSTGEDAKNLPASPIRDPTSPKDEVPEEEVTSPHPVAADDTVNESSRSSTLPPRPTKVLSRDPGLRVNLPQEPVLDTTAGEYWGTMRYFKILYNE